MGVLFPDIPNVVFAIFGVIAVGIYFRFAHGMGLSMRALLWAGIISLTISVFNCSVSRADSGKRLSDVKLVFETCRQQTGRDVHDLDRDQDGHPCEKDCGN